MKAGRIGPLQACPIPSPDGLPCQKTIPFGWPVEDGHGGGHWWASPETAAIFDGGHYDARALLSGQPANYHAPESRRVSPTGCGR